MCKSMEEIRGDMGIISLIFINFFSMSNFVHSYYLIVKVNLINNPVITNSKLIKT